LPAGWWVSALMDTLFKKGVLSVEETQAALQMAMDSVGPREMTKEGSGVSELTNFEQTLFRASRYDYAFEQ
jgi:hypothetical protein